MTLRDPSDGAEDHARRMRESAGTEAADILQAFDGEVAALIDRWAETGEELVRALLARGVSEAGVVSYMGGAAASIAVLVRDDA